MCDPCFPTARRGNTDRTREMNSRLLDNVFLEAGDERENLAFLFFRHFELVERCREMLGGCVPLGVRYAQSGVRRFHLAPHVNARTTRRGAELIENMLANSFL